MPEDLPEDMPEHMPEDMPDRMPEDMSDRMPEDLPVRKCINVIRSEVIGYDLIKEIHGTQGKLLKHKFCWFWSLQGANCTGNCVETHSAVCGLSSRLSYSCSIP
jgi:hypothetical protein